MNSAKELVIATTIYLFAYAALINLDPPPILIVIMGIIWPFVFVWMICCILKDTQFKYPELKDGQEWGYRDKDSAELGIF